MDDLPTGSSRGELRAWRAAGLSLLAVALTCVALLVVIVGLDTEGNYPGVVVPLAVGAAGSVLAAVVAFLIDRRGAG